MFKRLIMVSAMSALTAAGAMAAEEGTWSYTGEAAPENWGSLAPEYTLCASGSMQSPIDLAFTNTVASILVSVDWTAGPLVLQNSGKTIQANFGAGSHMTSSGKVFSLVQVHFHTPSEHAINGELYPLVAHFVHASDEGELAVLGILFEEGEENAELQKLIDGAGPAGADAARAHEVQFDPNALLPDELEIYRYMGSLTTPPCSEGVHWHVAEDTVAAHPRQLNAMARLMGENARPLQHVHSRLVIAPE